MNRLAVVSPIDIRIAGVGGFRHGVRANISVFVVIDMAVKKT
jgi:hypothetical protein